MDFFILHPVALMYVAAILAGFSGSQHTTVSHKDTSVRNPNIIYILADDLGYGELGVYGQQLIETPNIDALAASGMRFTQHYSGAPVCAPARCILLTGQHAGNAYIRGNDEWNDRGRIWDYQAMYENPDLEGQRPLPDSVRTLAEIMQSAGYVTGITGKWGLGAPGTAGTPNNQGFDFFYGYNCQRQAHTYYPMHLWLNEKRHFLNNMPVPPHSNLSQNADPSVPESYTDFELNDYAPELIHREALRFMTENKHRPFFLFYASPIPHLPLQAPRRWITYYEQKFGKETPYTGNAYFPNRTPRATYAAMISYLDEQVGELVSRLKSLNIYDETLILFSSDNGPSYLGGVDAGFFNSAGPFREGPGLTKGSVHEGGIRVPMIASWPGHIASGSVTDHMSCFYDVVPTLCELTGIPAPTHSDGKSFLPVLTGREQERHRFLYWEFPEYNGQQAVRLGKWKGIRKDLQQGRTALELFNLERDPEEMKDVAALHPEVVEQIITIMIAEHKMSALDRFRMESLGDVKSAYLKARKRVVTLQPIPDSLYLKTGYFLLTSQTKYSAVPPAEAALEELQRHLMRTGGYELKQAVQDTINLIEFEQDDDLSSGSYQLRIDSDKINILASGQSGFSRGMQGLLRIMDDKILQQKEMHRPVWTVAAATIYD